MSIIKMNKMIIAAMTDRDYNGFKTFVDSTIEELNEKEYNKLFESKFYIWNILRTKDFYKLFSRYIIERVAEEKTVTNFLTRLITKIIMTTKSDAVKYDFCRNLNRNGKYILTVGTLLCLHDIEDSEWLSKILDSTDMKHVSSDAYLKPFVDRIKKLEDLNTILTTT